MIEIDGLTSGYGRIGILNGISLRVAEGASSGVILIDKGELHHAVHAVDQLIGPLGRRREQTGRSRGHYHPPEVLERVGLERRGPDGTVKGDDVAALVDGVDERRDVAVPDEHLRLAGDEVVVEVRQHARRAPSACVADDTGDGVIGEEGVDVGGAVAVMPAEVAPAVIHMFAQRHFQPDSLELVFGEGDVVHGRRRGRRHDQPDGIAGRETFRPRGRTPGARRGGGGGRRSRPHRHRGSGQ